MRSISGYHQEWLSEGWTLAPCSPGACDGPGALAGAALDWIPTVTPSTAASSLRAAGRWTLDDSPRRFDAEDWWYRTTFTTDRVAPGEQLWLCFDGLATEADVWLNGEPLLSSAGMFTARERRIDSLLLSTNQLVIRFRALDSLLAGRRPRPRWRAPMVEHQQLRWYRTSLLGRTPGWSPPAAAVGPWRPVRLERRRGIMVDDVRLAAGEDGTLDVSCRAMTLDGHPASGGEIHVEREGRIVSALLHPGSDQRLVGRLQVPNVKLWWPHTHGESPLYDARLRVQHTGGTADVDLGSLGFRSVSLTTAGDDVAIVVNGAPVFCRGACWSPLDAVSLAAPIEVLDRAMTQVVTAGMNMLRVSGAMVYESDDFLDACDARGILLWQDFMFANMDYPEDDASFVQSVKDEIRQQMGRLQGRPSLAVLCGNSEVAQQAAMWGAPRERWSPPLFHRLIADIVVDACPAIPYLPSSTHGGAFPHQASAGPTSYYGVGAYRRPLDDARRAEVRFASECLAFANVMTGPALAASPLLRGARVHHAAWKARTPRDLGAGWDFDDVRDHYFATLFGLDPAETRASNHERYLALSRVVTGEVMAGVFGEWRRRRSTTRGGLIWFLRDLWPGAGWGVIDATGRPKPVWHYLRRALAPVALHLSDEGGNGIAVHLVNDGPKGLEGEIDITLYRGSVTIARGLRAVAVAARDASEENAALWFDSLYDLSYAYRFGPPTHDLMTATMRDSSGVILARACHFVHGLPHGIVPDVGLTAESRQGPAGGRELVVRTRDFAQSVAVELDGYVSDDDYFHLAPGEERVLTLETDGGPGRGPDAPLRGSLKPLNSETATPVTAGA
ncbi:MAG: glycoside hydrolase family 2 protein [Gemmatimonadota bacterium]